MIKINNDIYVEAKCDIADALLQAQGLPIIWVKDEHGNQRMDEETQLRFNDCYDAAECLLYNLNIEPEDTRHD